MNSQFIPQREVSSNQYTRILSPIGKYPLDSRPFSRANSVTAMRKKPWNRRFIYNKIPDYYQVKDKNIFWNKKPRVNSKNKNNLFDTNYITYQQSKLNYNRRKNITRGFNRTSSGFFSHNSYMTNNNEFTLNNRNIASPLTNSALNRNNLYKENINLNLNVNSNDENFNSIKKMWNELCVYMSYREVFIVIYNQLTGEEKEQFYQKELNELNTVKNDIKSLNYYIEQRTLILKDLYETNVKLNRKKNSDDVINELLVDMSDLIEKLREATVDVCYAMRKLKNDMNLVSNMAKYNIDLLSSRSKFDKNYLIKMKGELSFLKEGNAKFFFNISENRSPFLIKASDPNLTNEKDIFMRIVPLKEEIKEHIKECNYYIYQELIAYQQNILARKKIFRCVSPIKSNTQHRITSSSFINMNKEDFSQNNNNIFFSGVLNESNGFRKVNKNIFSEFPSDINSVLSTQNFFEKKMGMGMGIGPWSNINKQIPKPNKDLFSQKLLSGFIPGDWGQEIFAEDEKLKDEKEEEKENEEEEEDEEKSEDDTTRNELNELIEEKKSETDGNEDSNNKINSKINLEENKKINEDNKEKEFNDFNKNINKMISENNIENNNKEIEDNKNMNINNKNEDINKYLNNNNNIDIISNKSNSSKSKSKKNSIKEENKDDKILLNNQKNNLNNFSEKEGDKKSINSSLNKKEENNNNENDKEENKDENKNE